MRLAGKRESILARAFRLLSELERFNQSLARALRRWVSGVVTSAWLQKVQLD